MIQYLLQERVNTARFKIPPCVKVKNSQQGACGRGFLDHHKKTWHEDNLYQDEWRVNCYLIAKWDCYISDSYPRTNQNLFSRDK